MKANLQKLLSERFSLFLQADHSIQVVSQNVSFCLKWTGVNPEPDYVILYKDVFSFLYMFINFKGYIQWTPVFETDAPFSFFLILNTQANRCNACALRLLACALKKA